MSNQPVGFATKGHGRKRKVYPIYRGYKGMPRGEGMQVSSVVEAQQLRSPMARRIDAERKAPIAKSEEEWFNAPNRTDLPNIDMPKKEVDKIPPRKTEQPKPMVKPQMEGSTATYNKATNWLSITFGGVPPPEVRAELKQHGFRYEPYSKRWRASYSTYREDHLKKLAGNVEEINIAPNWAAKAEHAANQAAKHEAKSDELFEREHKLGEVIPFGQPILVGHYSEKADRNFRNRLENMSRKGVEEHQIAEKYQDRAERYGQKATGESSGLIYRRIQKLEADKRKMERELAAGETKQGSIYYSGNISDRRKEEIKRWINHYNSRLEVEREKYKASGGIATDNQQFKPGDIVFTRHGVGKIATISKKTARIRLDSDVGIYTNRKQESLMSVDSIKQKLTEEQIQKYKNALKEANKTSYIL